MREGNSIGNPGFQSTNRANPLAKKILASDIALGLNDQFTFYTADNCASALTHPSFLFPVHRVLMITMRA